MGLRPIKPHLLRLASDQLPEGLNGSHGLEYVVIIKLENIQCKGRLLVFVKATLDIRQVLPQ